MWKYVVLFLLSNNFRVVLYDLMGVSIIDVNNFSFKRYIFFQLFVDDLLVILDEFEIESCVYVGYFILGMIGCFVFFEKLDIF